MILAERNGNHEPATSTNLARDANAAAVQLDQLLHQRKSNPATLVRASAGALDAVKTFEQARNLFTRNASPSVAHGQFGSRIRQPERHFNLSLEGKLERVGEKIENHLFPHFAVYVNHLWKSGTLDDQSHPGALDGGTEYARELRGQTSQSVGA